MFNCHEEHAFNPSPHSPHTKIIKYISDGMAVLDVGCSTGYIGEKLKEKRCYVVGIEIDEAMAEVAKRIYDKVIIGNVDEIRGLPFPDRHFDVIIFSDVLEHLKRPDVILTRFKRYLNPDGFVIASIPNVARLEFRIKMLFGKFDYEESGILSKGHLKFFTFKTVKELFETAGYKIIKVDYTGLGSKFKVLPKLLAFQFLIVASLSKKGSQV